MRKDKTYKYNCSSLRFPKNMRILLLPNLTEFNFFYTIGPNGPFESNINGKAAAIECYLDTSIHGVVRWNNYKRALDIYQGELIKKDDYKQEFLSQTAKSSEYDYSKIEKVLKMLVDNSISIKESKLNSTLEFIRP